MTAAEILTMTKLNLEIPASNTLFDDYIMKLIEAAEQMIAREGIVLTDTVEDGNIVTMYAAYLYRKRANDSPVMPRMLRYALNNRLFSQKVGEADA